MHRIVAIVFGFTFLKPQFTILSQILRASQSHSFIDSTSHYPDSRVKHAQHRYNKGKKTTKQQCHPSQFSWDPHYPRTEYSDSID